MSLFYEGKWATLYRGDCRDVLPFLPRVDLVCTDPPYGINYDSGPRRQEQWGKIAGDDGTLDVGHCIDLALKVLRKGRHLYVFGPNIFGPLDVLEPVHLVWDKGMAGSGNLEQPWGPAWEPIWFAVGGQSEAERVKGQGNLTTKLRKGNVLHHKPILGRAATRHPTEKPVALMRELIESSTRHGDVVLDPFAGAGATLVAATIEGRKSIGIELEERYCQTAAERLTRAEAMYGRLIES